MALKNTEYQNKQTDASCTYGERANILSHESIISYNNKFFNLKKIIIIFTRSGKHFSNFLLFFVTKIIIYCEIKMLIILKLCKINKHIQNLNGIFY